MNRQSFDLDTPLMSFADRSGTAHFSVRDACQGTMIMGAIGSGKTSGPGAKLLKSMLLKGFGGLYLTVKESDIDLIKRYAAETSRTDDLVIIEPGGKHRFNLMEYESQNTGLDIPITQNIVATLKLCIEGAEIKESGRSNDQFWSSALDSLLMAAVDLCFLAYGKITIPLLNDIVLTAPRDGVNQKSEKEPNAFDKAYQLVREKMAQKIKNWETSLGPDELKKVRDSGLDQDAFYEAIPESKTFRSLANFFGSTYKHLNEKTKSIIDLSFSSFLEKLLRDPIYALFVHYSSTVTPESCLDGTIIVINLPVLRYGAAGRAAQVMTKIIWQNAMGRRNISKNDRPVFLWTDEGQHFIHPKDQEFNLIAREFRVCPVMLTQNIHNLYASMGGERSESLVKSYLGVLGTKIFNANSDRETNVWASDLIGEEKYMQVTEGSSAGGDVSVSHSEVEHLRKKVRPEEFAVLRTGAPKNNHIVEAIMVLTGSTFPGGAIHKKILFSQKSNS